MFVIVVISSCREKKMMKKEKSIAWTERRNKTCIAVGATPSIGRVLGLRGTTFCCISLRGTYVLPQVTLRALSLMSKYMPPFSSDVDIVGLRARTIMLHLRSQRGCITQNIFPGNKEGKPCQAPQTRADETSSAHLCWSLFSSLTAPIK